MSDAWADDAAALAGLAAASVQGTVALETTSGRSPTGTSTPGKHRGDGASLADFRRLRIALSSINDTLLFTPGMANVAADCHSTRMGRVIANALTTDVGAADLRNLLLLERMVVREARQPGMRIAGFLQAKNTLEAARAFDPRLKSGRASAMLELTVLREKPSFDMRSFVEGAEVRQADVVPAERFVALG